MRFLRFCIAVLIAGIVFSTVAIETPPALAEVPQDVIEKIATLKVGLDEARHLNNIAKISNADYSARTNAINAQIKALWQPYATAPRDDQSKAESAINGLYRAKLAPLTPQWQKEQTDFKTAAANREKQLTDDSQEDGRKAAEFQRSRLQLKKQFDSGAIDRATYDAKDREALAAITALRKKYEDAGVFWAKRFDSRMELATKAIADNPDVALPQSQVPATTTAPPDFARDVKLAADIAVAREENAFKSDKKLINSDAFRESEMIYGNDMNRLTARYQARAQEFENAWRQASAQRIQALRIKYYPQQYAAPTGPSVRRELPWYRQGDFIGYMLIAGLVLAVGGIYFFAYLSTRRRQSPESPTPPLSQNYGSAAWAPPREKPLTFGDVLGGVTPVTPGDVLRGVTFGKSGHPDVSPQAPGAPVTSLPETHSLIVARTRGGKGTRVIVPTLLRYSGSMIVIDPKGENAAITARTRRDQLHQTVHIVNPWGEMEDHYEKLGFKNATFNPLDAINPEDPNAVAIAQSLAAIICPPGDGKEQFWRGSAANVLAAVFLWLADALSEKKTLATARQIVTQSRAGFQESLRKMMSSTAYQGAIPEMVGQYVDMASDTYSGIMAQLAENTKFISDPRIKDATAFSSFSLKKLLDEFITVYVVIPHDYITTHATWLKLVIAAAMQGLKGRDKSIKRHHRCMFLIDEFGSIGHIADIPRDIALMSGYGLDFTLIVQGLDQLKDHYGEARGTILSNCAFKWFCSVNDLDSAKHLSESLGKATVRTVGKSTNTGTNPEGKASSGESTTYGETGRDLLTPDEILNLGRDAAILINPGGLPIYVRPVDYWDLVETFAHLKEEYAQFYWDPPLEYDQNPYFKGVERLKPSQGNGAMSRADALRVLGLGFNREPTDQEIALRIQTMMSQLEPGDDDIARKLSAVKAALLG